MGIDKKVFFRKTFALTSAISLMMGPLAEVAQAAPQNVTVASGDVNVALGTNSVFTQNSNRAILDMTSANIGSAESLTINMPNANAFQLNRVNSANPTLWDGAVNVNQGHVWFKNENGFVVGSGFRGNFGAGSNFGMSTHKNAGFSGDNIVLDGNSAGKIQINSGAQFNMSPGGYAAFVAPNDITNGGTINARLGRVEFASVDGVTVDMNGNGKINFLTNISDIDSAVVTNTGTINAQGGIVNLRADKAANVANSVINLNGVVNVGSMDATTFTSSTAKNGGELNATSYQNINSNVNLNAPSINLTATNGNIDVQNVTSMNTYGANTGEAIQLTGRNVTVRGNLVAANFITDPSTTSARANALVKLRAAENIAINGNTNILASSLKGGDAKLDIAAVTGDVTTKGTVEVAAGGVRVMSNTVNPSDVISNAEVKIVGKNVTHEKDVNVDSYAFHDMRTVISFLSKTSNERTAIGYYIKDANGNPVSGEVLFTDLQNLSATDFASLSLIDTTNVGYFIIPDGARFNSLSSKQPVTFKQVNGNWVAVNSSNQTLKGAAANGSASEYALFTDSTLNPSGGTFAADGTAAGNLNFEKLGGAVAGFDDFNFTRTDQTAVGTISASSKYDVTTIGAGDFTALGKLNITSETEAVKGTANSDIKIASAGKVTVNGPVLASATSADESRTSIDVTAAKDIKFLADVTALSTTVNRAAGKAYASLNFVNAGDTDITFNGKTLAQANGGNLARATVNADASKDMIVNDLLGTLANTTTGNDATADVTLRAKNEGNLNNADIQFLNGSYAFARVNSAGVSGRSTKIVGPTTITLKERLTTETTTQVQNGTRTETYTETERQQTGTRTETETYTEIERQQIGTTTENYLETRTETRQGDNNSCACRCSCMIQVTYTVPATRIVPLYGDVPVTKTRQITVPVFEDVVVTRTRTVPNYETRVDRTVTEIFKPDTTGTQYGPGFTATPPNQGPYKNLFLTQTPPPPVPPEVPYLEGLEEIPAEPVFTRLEPASGGGLFCRDVNTAGLPGLCGPAPVRIPELAPAAGPAPEPVAQPVYASPFRKGKSVGKKKAQVADLEPASGKPKCLNINGKKVCIEEAIDK